MAVLLPHREDRPGPGTLTMIFLGIVLATLVPLGVIAAVVGGIVAARRRHDAHEPDASGIGSLRRFVLYALQLVALGFAATGLSMLIGGAVDAAIGELVVSESDTELAAALAFTVVGVPAWLLLTLLVRRILATRPVEHRSELRRFALAVTRGVALSIVLGNALTVMHALLTQADMRGGPWGWLVVWAGVWVLHEQAIRAEAAPTRETRVFDRLYLYFGAVVGLMMGLTGMTGVVTAPLAAAYDAAFRSTLVTTAWDEEVRSALPAALIGGLTWAWHWRLNLARNDQRSTLWHIFVFFAGRLTGLVMAMSAAAVLLYHLLQWIIGVPQATNAAAHFVSTPSTVVTGVAGLLLWGYHRAVFAEAPPVAAPPTSARVYRYLVALAGLLLIAAAASTGIALVIDAATPRVPVLIEQGDWWHNQFVLVVTFILTGVPLWWFTWHSVQRTLAEGIEEHEDIVRRLYLFGVVGIGVLVLLVNLVIVLYQGFRAILGDGLSQRFVQDARWSVALAATAAVAAVYHWLVLREDQQASAGSVTAPRPRRRDVTVLATADADAVLAALEQIEGVHVRLWHRAPAAAGAGAATPDDARIAAILDRVRAVPGNEILVVIDDDGRDDMVIPYSGA